MIDPLEANPDAVTEMGKIIAQDHAWLSQLEDASNNLAPLVPNAIGSFGAKTGLFVLREKSGLVFSQAVKLHIGPDGGILDDLNRQVIGYSADVPANAQPSPLRLLAASKQTFASYEFDDSGILYGVRSQAGLSVENDRVKIGRLCIAFFPAPEKLSKGENDVFVATAAAGEPDFVPSDAPNVTGLERQPSSAQLWHVRESARQMWIASARAEIDVALADSKDLLDRIALDTVK
jgi:GAF domain-containing protein